MKLTDDNYYSPDANLTWVDYSTYKNFVGTAAVSGCEARGLALASGEIITEPTTSLLMGSYVDESLTGDIGRFKRDHPQLFSSRGPTKGELKSDYIQAQVMVDRAKRDDLFMSYMEGQKQRIMTGKIGGIPVRIKMDVYQPDGESPRIVDLKTCKSITELNYSPEKRQWLDFISFNGYLGQAAFYQEVVAQNTGKRLPFYIAAISKDKTNFTPHPRIAVIELPQEQMDTELEIIKDRLPMIKAILDHEINPVPCMRCDYCADTYQTDRVIGLGDLYE